MAAASIRGGGFRRDATNGGDMSVVVTIIALGFSGAIFALAVFYAAEIGAAFLGARPARRGVAEFGPLAILIPAHDEAASIATTIGSVKQAARDGDRIVVVADNCTDATADIARRAGAIVLVRTDPERRGKGYALQFGVDALRADPPAGVVVVDADCLIGETSLRAIADAMAATGRPAQMLYRMRAPEHAPAQRRIGAFAWLLMNSVRMRGLDRMAGGARVTGAGAAFPWSALIRFNLASAEIVEDLALYVRLVEAGLTPTLVENATVDSVLPVGERSALAQRARWENGSMRVAATAAPRLILSGLARRDFSILAAGLDLALPPLTIFIALIGVALLFGGAVAAAGSALPLMISGAAAALFFGATAAAWARFGRTTLRLHDLLGAGAYIVGKLSVYFGRARATTKVWTRTERDAGPENLS